MFAFAFRRLFTLIPTFFGITILSFVLIHSIPGDPVEVMMGEKTVDPVLHAQALKRLGLDLPLPEQYWNYLKQLAHGDLGTSFRTQNPVWGDFKIAFTATAELAIFALTLAVVLGLILGVTAAVKRGSIFDHGVMTLALTGYSMPIFWWGLMAMMFFSVYLGWLPVSGRLDLMFDIPRVTGFMLIDSFLAENAHPLENKGAFKDAVMHLILPAIVLGTNSLAIIARMTRSAMLEVLKEDYIRTAKAKGLSPLRVIFVHALRNALIPVITIIGLQLGGIFSGAVLTETIFSWPGIGTWLVNAIGQRDYPIVQSGILIIATLVILTNFMVDLLYGVVSPRIRHEK